MSGGRFIIPKYLLEFFETRSKSNIYDKNYFPSLKVLFAPENEGKCICEMKIEQQHVNIGKVLHGGLTASLVDSVSTAALYNTIARKTGVSVNINMSYIRPVKLNETILIDAKVLNAGSKLAYLGVNIYLKNDDKGIQEVIETLDKLKLVAHGTHTKFIL